MTVEIDEEVKTKLEGLQAAIERQTGKKVAQREIVARLIDSAYESRSTLVESFRDDITELSADELAQFNQGLISSGDETEEEDIDETLYG